jgi:hypothetical protein
MTTVKFATLSLGLMVCFSFFGVGCQRSRAASGASSPAAPGTAANIMATQSKVTRIVFVGKEHACDCTRKTVDAGWAALQKTLGTPAKLPVERFQIDTEADKVAPYRQQKPVMALPGIYFVDSKGAVLELLQGDVTAEQIAAVLQLK